MSDRKTYMSTYRVMHRKEIYHRRKIWLKANPDKRKEYERKRRLKPAYKEYQLLYRVDHKQHHRDYILKRKFGISLHQYKQMKIAQGGVCALCGATNGSFDLAVDHDHTTGKVRGLLCGSCNGAMERIDNVPGWTEKAHLYKTSFYTCSFASSSLG